LSENGPPKLRKPGTNNEKKGDSRKFKKPDTTHIREKLGSLNIKKQETSLKNKVSSFKSKSKGKEDKKEGPLKIRRTPSEPQNKSRSNKLKKDSARILSERPILSIIGIVILIILVVSVAMWAVADKKPAFNQSNNTTNQTNMQKNHFYDGNISFDYPEGWNVTNSTDSSSSQSTLIVTVSKDENNSFSVFKESLGTQNFTYRVASWRSNILQNGMIYYEGDLTIDNTTAYELEANYKPSDKVFTTRGIAFQKNNTAYFLIFVFDHPLLDYKNEMDKVINSFHVIETPKT
jgi:hypothetical protein